MGEAAIKPLPLTGWKWEGSTKDYSFDVKFKALGVKFNLQHALTESRFEVANAGERVKCLCASMMRSAAVAAAGGEAQFRLRHFLGRMATAVLWQLRMRAAGALLSSTVLLTSGRVGGRAQKCPTAHGPSSRIAPPVILCTYGFCDVLQRQGGEGVIILDEETGTYEVLGQEIRQGVAQEHRRAVGASRIVGKTELITAVAARTLQASCDLHGQ